MKLTALVLVIGVLADYAAAVPPEYDYKRYVYRKKSRSVITIPRRRILG